MKRVILLIGSNRGYELLKSVNDYFKDKEDFELFIFTVQNSRIAITC